MYNISTCKNESLMDLLSTLESGKRPQGGIGSTLSGAISLGGENISNKGINLNKIRFVPKDFYQKAKKGFVYKDDILICKDGALTGKVCYIDIDFPVKEVMINEHVYIIRSKPKIILQKYLFYSLNSKYIQNQIKNLAYNKTAQPGLNRKHIEFIQIPLPPLHIQQQIVDRLEYERKMIEAQEKVKQYFANKIQNKLKSIWQDVPQQETSTNQEQQMIEAQNEIITYFEQKIQSKLDSIWHQVETKQGELI